MAGDPIFSKHDVSTVSYKEINGHRILLGVVVPKGLTAGTYPLIVTFHGGFLVTGAHAEWFKPWLIQYSPLHSAFIVSPDHRLLPEANGLNVLEDLSHFWNWIQEDLQSHLLSDMNVDLDRVLVEGESAGGYLAIQSAISQGSKIKAVIASYAPIDTIEKHMATLKGGEVVSTATPPARMDLAFSSIQQGKFVEPLGTDSSLFPMEGLDSVENMPAVFILHGKMTPQFRTSLCVTKLRVDYPEVKILYLIVPDQEHGLDSNATFETPWLKEGLEFITREWLEKDIE